MDDLMRALLRQLLRPLLLIGAVMLVAALLTDFDPVPFRLLLAAAVPACLLGILLFRGSLRETVEEERRAREQSEGQLEKFARINAELTRELLESRVLDEEHQLRVKAF